MYDFWFPAAILMLLACLFVLVPSLRFVALERNSSLRTRVDTQQSKGRIEQNVLIYKEKLQELEQDKESGALSTQEFTQLKQELDNLLIEDAEELSKSLQASSQEIILLIPAACAVFVIVLSAVLYNKFGAYNDVVHYFEGAEQDTALASATEQARNGDMTALLEQLHGKLKLNPDNIQGWGLLARTAMNTERYTLAIEAFDEVIRLLKTETQIDYQDLAATYGILAQAHYYASQGKFTSDVEGAITLALKHNPAEPNTLSLLAINAFTAGEFEKAIEHWSRVLVSDPDHPAAKSFKQGINEAQRRAELPLTDFYGQDKSHDEPSILVQVSLSDNLLARVKPEDTVFIFAKNAESAGKPSPPLAASRHTASELPITIALSDINSMSPAAKLSDANNVNIIARISKSGQVSAASGDLEGSESDVQVQGAEQVNIIIDTAIK